jgi:hypothetical protein
MKKLIVVLSLFSLTVVGQTSDQLGVMLGEKCIELSGTKTVSNGMIFGGAVSVISSSITERRANNHDINKHDFKGDYVPAVFGLIGGEFGNFSMIGKLGSAYLEQEINSEMDSQKFYFVAGITFDFKVSDGLALRTSFDSINGLMAGITLHL